jgi:hypothetical protein
MQWVLGTVSVEVKRQGREANLSPPSSTNFNNGGDIYVHFPIRLHGVVLNSLSSGINVPF